MHTIKAIKDQFVDIRRILREAPVPEALRDAAYVARLSEGVEEGYFSFNTAISQESAWCRPCFSRRNSLRDVVVLLADLENGAAVTSKTVTRMEAFPAEVDAIIAQIDTALNA